LHDIARQTKGVLLDVVNAGANRDTIFNAALDELERGAPSLVVFEDMHWADEATLDLLKFLGRRIDRTHAMLVVTYRDDEVGPRHPLRFVIGDLPRTQSRRMILSPLSELAVAKLARQAGRSPAALHSVTGGNPLFVTEVLAAGTADVPVSVRDAVLARAVRLSPAAREIAELVCVVLSRLAWYGGRRNEATRYAAEAVATLESLPCSPELAMAYSNRAQLDLISHELESAIQGARRTLELAERWGNEDIRSHALATLGTARLIGGDTTGWGLIEESLRLARNGGFHEHVARAYYNLFSMAVSRREYDLSRRYREEGISYCDDHDLNAWRLYILACSARSKLEQGDWEGCSEDVDTVLRNPSATPTTRVPALTALAQLRIRRGDPDPDSPLEEAQTLAESLQELQRLATLAAARAEVAWLDNDREGVIRAVRPIYDRARQKFDPRMNGELAIWLFRVNALDDRTTQFAEPYASEIAGKWRAAAHAWKEIGCPYEHATSLALYGSEAEKREALTIFEALGASPASRALRKQCRAEGIKGVPRGARATTQSNQYGLTKREAEVLSLLSRGMRNSAIARALFVSHKTVDHHVSSILSKLGVPSRGEAVVVTQNQVFPGR
jgi:DNA-binding CsgD family transcriptional regulator